LPRQILANNTDVSDGKKNNNLALLFPKIHTKIRLTGEIFWVIGVFYSPN